MQAGPLWPNLEVSAHLVPARPERPMQGKSLNVGSGEKRKSFQANALNHSSLQSTFSSGSRPNAPSRSGHREHPSRRQGRRQKRHCQATYSDQTAAGPRPEQVLSKQLSQTTDAPVKQTLQDALDKVKQAKFQSLSLRDQRASLLSRAKHATSGEGGSPARSRRQGHSRKGLGVQRILRGSGNFLKAPSLARGPVPEPAKTVSQAGPAPAELKLLLAYVQAKASEGCGDANSICGLLQHNVQDGGNPVRPVLEIPSTDHEGGNQVRPGPSVDPALAGEWTKVGPGLQPAFHHAPRSLPLCGDGR
eukprot:2700428-Amphidinium_carterae.2